MSDVKIVKKDADWKLAKNECRTTVNKSFTDNEPSNSFIHNLIISEHSPLRLVRYIFKFEDIPYFVSTHLVRHHTSCEKFVGTQRTDRTGINRNELPQNNPVTMDMEVNGQGLVDISRKRLCYQASKETRELWESVKRAVKISGEIELSNAMVPNCIYRAGCPEFASCGYWDKFKEWALQHGYDLLDIHSRYMAYNEYITNGGKE